MLYFSIIILIFNSHLLHVEGHEMKIFVPEFGMTTPTVKEALSVNIGFHEQRAKTIIRDLRKNILLIGGLSNEDYTVIPVQGPDYYGFEATIRTVTPKNGKVLILNNGYSGDKILNIITASDLNYYALTWNDGESINIQEVEDHLKTTTDYTTVTMAHFEVGSSMLNPLKEISNLVKKYLPTADMVVDVHATYGCLEFEFNQTNIQFLHVSSGWCLQAFPGISYIVAKREEFQDTKGNIQSFSFDLNSELKSLDETEEPRYPVSIQLFSAALQASTEHLIEGIENKIQRYESSRDLLEIEVIKLGFVPYTNSENYVSTTFYCPQHAFNFSTFQQQLEDKGVFISPISLTETPTFRIGYIGNIYENDCNIFIKTAKIVLESMNVSVPFPAGPYVTLNTTTNATLSSSATSRDVNMDTKHFFKKHTKKHLSENPTGPHQSTRLEHHYVSEITHHGAGKNEQEIITEEKHFIEPKSSNMKHGKFSNHLPDYHFKNFDDPDFDDFAHPSFDTKTDDFDKDFDFGKFGEFNW